MIFPRVLKAGFGIGGEYGEGALYVNNETVEYYSTASASIGLQIGAQARAQVILFMDESALEGFRNKNAWEAGVVLQKPSDARLTSVEEGGCLLISQ